MILTTRGSLQRSCAPLVPPALIATTTGVLLRFPPAQNSFYPRCPIYDLLHLQCPGCGATRALAALLHGHFNEAMHLNGLTTLLLPVGVICGIRWYCRFVRREVDHWPQVPRVALYAALAASMMFTVVRNLLLSQFR